MITEDSSLEEVCFAVASALEAHGIEAILSGGSAATLYAPAAYSSYDADFVLPYDDPLEKIEAIVKSLGFTRVGRSRIFAHARSKFTIDFPKGPLAVGGEYVKAFATIRRHGLTLHILSRTDCVRDRLSHFYFWNDYTALNASVAVAAEKIDEVDLSAIEAWTEREDPKLLAKFAEFERRLDAAIRRGS